MSGNAKGGSITALLTSCLTGLESAVWLLTFFVFICKNRLVQTSQTGGQRYSDTSPFSIPCLCAANAVLSFIMLIGVIMRALMLFLIILSVNKLSVTMLRVITLSVAMLSVITLR